MHKGIRWTSLALFSLALVGAGAASAENKGQTGAKKGQTTTTTSAACPTDDKGKLESVMKFLHTSNQSEVKHGKLAIDRAQSPEVKSFADRMVKEHEDADKKLTDLAMKKGIDLTAMTQPADPIHAAMMGAGTKMDQSLQTKKGAAFDAAFMGPEVMEHSLVLAVIEEGQKAAKDEDVKKLLTEQYQAVSQHKDHASTILDKMKPAGTGVGGGPGNEPSDKDKMDKSKTDKSKTDKTDKSKTDKSKTDKSTMPKQDNPDWVNPDMTHPDMNK